MSEVVNDGWVKGGKKGNKKVEFTEKLERWLVKDEKEKNRVRFYQKPCRKYTNEGRMKDKRRRKGNNNK